MLDFYLVKPINTQSLFRIILSRQLASFLLLSPSASMPGKWLSVFPAALPPAQKRKFTNKKTGKYLPK